MLNSLLKAKKIEVENQLTTNEAKITANNTTVNTNNVQSRKHAGARKVDDTMLPEVQADSKLTISNLAVLYQQQQASHSLTESPLAFFMKKEEQRERSKSVAVKPTTHTTSQPIPIRRSSKTGYF